MSGAGASDAWRFADLKQPELARGPGVHDGRRTEPCLCAEPSDYEVGMVEDEGWSPDFHPQERRYRDGYFECGFCGGDGFRYVDCTRCAGSGHEPA